MLSTGSDYRDLGEAYLDQLDHEQTARDLVRRLELLAMQLTR
jgi:transposase